MCGKGLLDRFIVKQIIFEKLQKKKNNNFAFIIGASHGENNIKKKWVIFENLDSRDKLQSFFCIYIQIFLFYTSKKLQCYWIINESLNLPLIQTSAIFDKMKQSARQGQCKQIILFILY